MSYCESIYNNKIEMLRQIALINKKFVQQIPTIFTFSQAKPPQAQPNA